MSSVSRASEPVGGNDHLARTAKLYHGLAVSRASEPVGGIAKSNARPQRAVLQPVRNLNKSYAHGLAVSRASEPVGDIAKSNARPQRARLQPVRNLNKSYAHGLGGRCYGDAHLPRLSVFRLEVRPTNNRQ